MELSDGVIERLRLGAITAIDGLWFLAVERKLGFEEAFRLDLEVWKAYGQIQFKRLARALGVSFEGGVAVDLATVNFMLEALCRIDGTEGQGELTGDDTVVFTVHRCPWWENLNRAGRSDLVDCETIDNAVFFDWLKNVNPCIHLEITRSMPRGDNHCSWTLTRARPATGRD